MLKRIKLTPEKLFYILLGLYFTAGLLNLGVLPIAWTDEAMNLDPALQWHKHGEYKGFLWPNRGSDQVFLAYPPLIQWFHIAVMYLMPFDIFYLRLPFLLLYVIAIFLVFRFLKSGDFNVLAALMLIVLFVSDKVVFEISRSMRVEVLEIFLISVLIFLKQKPYQKFWFTGILLGLLTVAHLKMWPLVFLWLLAEWLNGSGLKYLLKTGVVVLIPLLAFLIFIGFDIQSLMSQMFSQAEKHTIEGGLFRSVINHFFGGFWPVYKEQPWNLVVPAMVFISAIRQIFIFRYQAFFSIIFTGTFVVWILVLAAHYRYWPPLYLLGIAVLASDPWAKKLKWEKIFVVFKWAMPLMFAGIISRHALAMFQRKERAIEPVHQWLRNEISFNQKTLILGNAAAFYMSDDSNLDYGMLMYPQNLHFENYEKVFLLSRDSTSLHLMDEYSVQSITLPVWVRNFGKGDTYAGLKLYEIQSKAEWDKLIAPYKNDYR